MAIQISYQPAAATIGGMAGLAGSAEYMKQLYPQLVQQQQFAAQQKQQRDMAMYQAAVAQQQQQQQFQQQLALEQQRFPQRLMEEAMREGFAAERTRAQVQAQTQAESDRLRQEYGYRDVFDQRSGERQLDIANRRMENEAALVDKREESRRQLQDAQAQNVLNQIEARGGVAIARDRAEQAAMMERTRAEMAQRAAAENQKLTRDYVQYMASNGNNPLAASDKLFERELQSGWKFSPDQVSRRQQLANDVTAIYRHFSSGSPSAMRVDSVATEIMAKVAELNSIQPSPPETAQSVFDSQRVQIFGQDGSVIGSGYFSTRDGKFIPLPAGSPPIMRGPDGGTYLQQPDGKWQPVGPTNPADAAKALSTQLDLQKKILDMRISASVITDPGHKQRAFDDITALEERIGKMFGQPATAAGGQPATAVPGGQPQPQSPAAGNGVQMLDTSEVTIMTGPDGKAVVNVSPSGQLISFSRIPGEYERAVAAVYSDNIPWDPKWDRVGGPGADVGVEAAKPFPAAPGRPASSIPANGMASEPGKLLVGKSPEFLKRVVPQAIEIANVLEQPGAPVALETVRFLSNTLDVLNSMYTGGGVGPDRYFAPNPNALPPELTTLRQRLITIALKLKEQRKARGGGSDVGQSVP